MTYSIEAFDTELNRNVTHVYRNYEHYLKATTGLENISAHRLSWVLSVVSPQVRELINDVREKNEQKEEYYRQMQERKNKYPHLFK